MTSPRFVVLLAVLLMAGCSQKPQASDPVDSGTPISSATNSETAPSEPKPPLNATLVPSSLDLNECQGLASLFMFPASAAPAGDEVPPGWEQDNPTRTEYRVIVLLCERISVGPFERGPVHVLFETHDRVNAPEACGSQEPASLVPEVLRSIWFDDAQIVDYLATVLAMPARLGIFTADDTDLPSFAVRRWSWMEPGGPQSELVFNRLDSPVGGNPHLHRLFWHSDGAVSLIDVSYDTKQPLVTPPENVGIFRSPMMFADTGVEAYSGLYSIVDPGASYPGEIRRFGDLECKNPLS